MESRMSLPICLTKMMFGWTKWGGPTRGLATYTTVPERTWSCQVCGDTQVNTLPTYMIPFDDSWRDFVKVCAKCKWKGIHAHIKYLHEYLRIIRGIENPDII